MEQSGEKETRYKNIDNKAVGIISITGILMTFSVFFLVTIILSIMAMSVRQTEALSTKYLIENLKNESPERQIRGIIGTIAEAEADLRKVGNAKANWMRYSVYALGISVALLILYSLTPLLD